MAVGQLAVMAQGEQGPLDRPPGSSRPVSGSRSPSRALDFFCLNNAENCAGPDQLLRSAGESSWCRCRWPRHGAAPLPAPGGLGRLASDRRPGANGVTLPLQSQIGQPPKNSQKRPKHNWDHTVSSNGLAPQPNLRDAHPRHPCGVGSPCCAWQKPSGRLILLIPAGWSLWLAARGPPAAPLVGLIVLAASPSAVPAVSPNDPLGPAHRPFGGSAPRPTPRQWSGECGQRRRSARALPAAGPLLVVGLAAGRRAGGCPACWPWRPCRRCCSIPLPNAGWLSPSLLLAFCWGFRGADPLGLRPPVRLPVAGPWDLVWAATLLWTFGFDTVYAMADRRDDAPLGLRSSALSLGPAAPARRGDLLRPDGTVSGARRPVAGGVLALLAALALAAIGMQQQARLLRGQPAAGLFGRHFHRQVQLGGLLLAGPAAWTGRMSASLAPRQAGFCRRRLCGPVSGWGCRGQFSPRRPLAGWSRGWPCLRTGALVVERPFDSGRRWGYMAGDDQQAPAAIWRPGPACWPVCAVVGGQPGCLEQPLPEQAGWLLGYSDVTSLLWARLALGLGGGIHGRWSTGLASEPEWSQAAAAGVACSVSRCRRCRANPGRAAWRKAPCWWPTSRWRPTCSAPRFCLLWRGAVLILEDVGEAPYRIERLLNPLAPLRRLATAGWSWLRQFP